MVSIASHVRPLSGRRFFRGMAIATGIATFAGFAPTYYLVGFQDAAKVVLTPRIHIHGALATAWVLLFIIQAQLIATGRREIHKRLGIAGIALAAAIFISGIYVAISSQRRIHTVANAGTFADPYVFLIFPTAAVCSFAVLVLLAVLLRQRAEIHKRLMLLATVNLIGPALARIVTQIVSGLGIVGPPGAIGAFILMDAFIAALLIYDYKTRGRILPVTLWAGGLIILSQPLRVAIAFTEPWQDLARSLMG